MYPLLSQTATVLAKASTANTEAMIGGIIIAVSITSVVIFAIVMGIKSHLITKRTIFIHVDLESRKSFNNFNINNYLMTIDSETLTEIEAITNPENKKEFVKIVWTYVTPAGRDIHQGNVTYNTEETLEYLKTIKPVMGQGIERITHLNKIYQERLPTDIEDGIHKIYGYVINGLPSHQGLIKIGQASGSVTQRIKQQFKTAAHLTIDYEILFIMPAITINDKKFTDHEVHKQLKNQGIENPMGEWFRCNTETAQQTINKIQTNNN